MVKHLHACYDSLTRFLTSLVGLLRRPLSLQAPKASFRYRML